MSAEHNLCGIDEKKIEEVHPNLSKICANNKDQAFLKFCKKNGTRSFQNKNLYWFNVLSK